MDEQKQPEISETSGEETQKAISEPAEQKRPMPKVSPATMVMTFIFAVVFCIGVYFFPYIEAMLPWGGSSVKGELYVQEYSHDQLISQAHSVIVGEAVNKRDNILQERPTADGLNYIIYSEVDIKVDKVLYGEPYVDDNGLLVTYELGGRREFTENGRPKIIKITYDNAAELKKGEKVILFLDDQNNIMGEKYGVYRLHKDNYYYDYSQAVYSVSGIQSELDVRTS